jgi:hypothetical protein
MSAVDHPINLQKVFFTRSVVIAVPGHEPAEGQPPPLPENNLSVSPVADRKGLRVATMKSVFNPNQDKAFPYSVDMECVALFTVNDTLTEAEAERGLYITANSVCYGAIREAVSWLTGRQPFGEMIFGLSILRLQPPAPPAME